MIFTDLFESKDMCHVCGQTPCNCTHIAESAGSVGDTIRSLYQQFYDQGDDALEYLNTHAENFARYWDRFEGDLDSMIEELPPKILARLAQELQTVAAQEGLEEEKVRLDPKCWSGKKIGNPKTKMKGGVRVNNCVPAESVEEDLTRRGFLKGAGAAALSIPPAFKAMGQDLDLSDKEITILAMLFDAYWVCLNYPDRTDPEKCKRIQKGISEYAGKRRWTPQILNGFYSSATSQIREKLQNPKWVEIINGSYERADWLLKELNQMRPFESTEQDVSENYDNGEYSDEAGMAHSNLITIARAAEGLLDTIDQHEDLPEWVQEKIAKVEGMLVSAWNYLQSQEAQGIDPRVSEMYANLAENWQRVSHRLELNQEFDLIESIVESIADRNGVNAEAVWADLESLTEDELYVFAVTSEPIMEDWQKANKRDKTDGMSQKAVNAYRREHPGSKLKTAVTTKPSKLKKGSKASKRRKSYCSRSRGQMKMHHISCAKTPDKAICKARRRWNCEGVDRSNQTVVAEGDMYGDQEVSWEKGGRRAPTGAFRNPAAEKPHVRFHPDYDQHEKKLISKMSNAEKADKGWRNPNIDEQGVAEVSDATLTSYLTKVDADSQKHDRDPTKRSPEKRNKSVSGFARAFNKLDARKEKVDELSKQKLGDYLHAAHQDVVDRATSSSFQSGKAGDKYNKADVSPKEKQRQAGMARAVNRLTRENSMADELARMAMKRNPNALVRVDGKTLQSPAPGPKPAGTTAPRPAPKFDPEAEYSDDYSAWHRRTQGISEGSSIAEAWARRYPNINKDIAECKTAGDSDRLSRLMSIKNIIDSELGEQAGLGFGQ
jgi:hypothetical protein